MVKDDTRMDLRSPRVPIPTPSRSLFPGPWHFGLPVHSFIHNKDDSDWCLLSGGAGSHSPLSCPHQPPAHHHLALFVGMLIFFFLFLPFLVFSLPFQLRTLSIGSVSSEFC